MSFVVIAAALAAVVAVLVVNRRTRSAEVLTSRRRRAYLLIAGLLAIQSLMAAPAWGQGLDCKEAPNPERPGSGMVGALDPAPMGAGNPGSAYDEVGYAGLIWHTYDLGCGPQGVTNPNALVDTWVGNELFNLAKNLVGATNGLHYALLNGDLMDPLDEVIATGTVALYDSVFAPWFGIVALVLAVVLFRYIWQGDLASIGKRGMWALAALWFASATYLTPLVYTHALDEIVITGTSAVQAGFLHEVGVDEANALPTLLHDQVIYRNWLRGEFGSPDSPQAQQLGRELLRAQAWTKQEVNAGADGGSPEPKKQAFEDVAGKMGSAYGYFQGIDGSRVGAGVLGSVQSLAYASFQLLAKATILLAQVLLRVLILAGPLIGLIALVYHQILRMIGRVAGAAVLNVVMVSALAGLHTLILTWIFDPTRGFSALTQILLAALITIVFLMIARPIRRIAQMVELSVGTVGRAAPRAQGGIFARFGRRGENPSGGEFWDQVRDSDPDDEYGDRPRRRRPEALLPAVAQRLDRDDDSAPQDSIRSGGAVAGALPAGGGSPRRPGGMRGVPEMRAASRVVDTNPVADAKWDGNDEDPVLIPSRATVERVSDQPAGPDSPRLADREVVQGRPVHVIYRPSRGLEVADG
ncbi:type IV secretion system protein [Saccharopolyspora aridisoli]|nr:type IV secretion system protein [Saccharopolyspora aridisoli]